MTSALNEFPITRRWVPRHPDRLQLYSLPTPNGVKVSIMLEECGLPYEAHRVDFARGDQRTPEFLSLNPNGKIPAILDPDGPGRRPLGLSESGTILLYLASKTGLFMPRDPALAWQANQWLMWQMSAVGPMFGQVGYFHKFDGRQIEDKRPLQRYVGEAQRLLGLLDQRLQDRPWVMGDDYTIVDISLIGMVRNLVEFYGAGDLVGYADFTEVHRWLAAAMERPAVQRGLKVASA